MLPITLVVLGTRNTVEEIESTLVSAAAEFEDVMVITTRACVPALIDHPQVDRLVMVWDDDEGQFAEQMAMLAAKWTWVFLMEAGERLPMGMIGAIARALNDGEIAQVGAVAIIAEAGRAIVRLRHRDRWATGPIVSMGEEYMIPPARPLPQPVGVPA